MSNLTTARYTSERLGLAWKHVGQSVAKLYKARSYIVPAIKETLFFFGLWQPATQPHAKAAERFAHVNSKLWKQGSIGNELILVEGHLAEYGPNYLFRTGLAAKAIQSVIGGEAVVVVNGFSYQWTLAREGYRSFGITRWVFLGRRFVLIGPVLFLVSCVRAGWFFLRIRTPHELLDLHCGNIKIGDLVYDEILRTTGQPTVKSVDWAAFKVMQRSWYYYYQYQMLFSLKSYRYFISTHTAYPEYGLLCRVALQRKVAVIETSDIQMSVYDSIAEEDLPTYHQGIHSEISTALSANEVPAQICEERARESLDRRLNSEIKQIDAQKAYSGQVYTRKLLYQTLGIADGVKIGFIAAHIFRDSPHLSSSMLHADYYCWLVDTIDCCASANNIAWIVKPHPSCSLYGENGMVEDLVRDKGAGNIYMCPTDLHTASLRDCADVILTVHGTIGLEYACLGVPTILAGTPFYAGFGFTHEPLTAAAYRELVRDAGALDRLSQAQISTALRVFEAWERQFDWNNPIVDSAVLANVWGNGVPRDVTRAYELLTENLLQHDPKELKLWEFASAVARGSRSVRTGIS